MTESQEKNQGQETANTQMGQVEKLAFDPINLIDNPFCLLSRKQVSEDRISLSPGGSHYLISTPPPPELWDNLAEARANKEAEKYGMPTALAERVLLAMLWLTKDKNGFKDQIVEFQPRELVERYMYPESYADSKKRAGGKQVRRAENELYRIANTKIVTENWYFEKKRIRMDASIISSIAVVEEGRGSAPKILRVTWARELFDSIRGKYTKGINFRKFSSIKTGLALRLYRWIDRQLGCKSKEVVKSCIKWAEYELLMRHYKVTAGGRTASSYIVGEVDKIIKRLHSPEFPVRFTYDDSRPDFTLTFERIEEASGLKEVKTDDSSDLIKHFSDIFYKGEKGPSVYPKDRDYAEELIESFGLARAKKFIEVARKFQKKTNPENPPRFFRGLLYYEDQAMEKIKSDEKRMKVSKAEAFEEEIEKAWKKHFEVKIREYLDSLDDLDKRELNLSSERRAREVESHAWKHGSESTQKSAIERSKRSIIKERLGFDRGQFETSYRRAAKVG